MDDSHNNNYDFMRLISAVGVVVLHVSAQVVTTSEKVNSYQWWIGNFFDSFVRWCVPIFVMISGSLLLTRGNILDPIKFFHARIRRLAIPLLFWTFFYLLFRRLTEPGFGIREAIYNVITGTPYYHLWYLYMLLGLCLIAPFLKAMISNMSKKNLQIFITGMLILSSLDVTWRVYNISEGGTFLSMFIPFIGYFTLGFYLNLYPSQISKRTFLSTGATSGLLIAIITSALFAKLGTRSWALMYSYVNPLVVTLTVSVFCLLEKIRKYPSFLRNFFPLTLGIYLIHPFWLKLLNDYHINGHFINPVVGISLTVLLTIALSSASTWSLLKFKFLRAIVT